MTQKCKVTVNGILNVQQLSLGCKVDFGTSVECKRIYKFKTLKSTAENWLKVVQLKISREKKAIT